MFNGVQLYGKLIQFKPGAESVTILTVFMANRVNILIIILRSVCLCVYVYVCVCLDVHDRHIRYTTSERPYREKAGTFYNIPGITNNVSVV